MKKKAKKKVSKEQKAKKKVSKELKAKNSWHSIPLDDIFTVPVPRTKEWETGSTLQAPEVDIYYFPRTSDR